VTTRANYATDQDQGLSPTSVCTKFGCEEAILDKIKGFWVCPKCGASYGKNAPERPAVNPKTAAAAKKLALHLVPPAATALTADTMEEGADKYGAYNFRDVPVKISVYVAAIKRHVAAYEAGDDVDRDSKRGNTNLGAILACAAILADATAHGNLVDDRAKSPGTAALFYAKKEKS
jgi:hypothetical protein